VVYQELFYVPKEKYYVCYTGLDPLLTISLHLSPNSIFLLISLSLLKSNKIIKRVKLRVKE